MKKQDASRYLKGGRFLLQPRLNLIQACEKAAKIVTEANEMELLYRRAVRSVGEGELRTGILNMATEAMSDEALKDEVFVSDDSILSFFCGVWLQYLLIEIAGVKKEKLQTLAERITADIRKGKSIH